MKKRKILAITGARSEYDLLYVLFKKLQEDQRFDLKIVISGSHLSEKFGYSAKLIKDDGFQIADEIYNLIDSDKKIGRIVSLGYQIPLLAHCFEREKPDIILVAGDREEAISVTLTAAYMGIAVAHFFGGDIAKDGNIDNSVRYAASKFAHLHFVTLDNHKSNLLKLGEDEWRIFVSGNPGLDRLMETPNKTRKELSASLNFDIVDEQYFVLIQHSIITETNKQREHINVTLEAIRISGVKCFINYPNSDAGNHEIIVACQKYSSKYPNQFKLFKNLDRITYVNLLRHAKCLVGNSSSGLLEAPSLGLAAINVGSRQVGRIHGNNVIFVKNSQEQILGAINKVFNDVDFEKKLKQKENPYGDGKSSDRILDVLSNVEINNELIHKNITY